MIEYRIKRTIKWYYFIDENGSHHRRMPTFKVQMKIWFLWITVKSFFNMWDPDNARQKAENLFNLLKNVN